MNTSWSGNFNAVQIQFATMVCQRCSHPDAVVLKRSKLVELLEEARRIVHPDVNQSDRATAVTAQINALLDEVGH